jgi:hypothetical protein
MKRPITLLILLTVPGVVRADYVPTSLSWPGWTVSSSENLYAGRRHTSYPLVYMLDGDPKTAWVFSGTGKVEDEPARWRSPYTVRIEAEKPFSVDGLRLMNGYNKSVEVFQRNDRIVQVRVSLDGTPVKTTALADSMGWHTVSLPRRRVRQVTIELTGIKRGPDKDVCLSELELMDGGKRVDMHVPKVVLYNHGSDCG